MAQVPRDMALYMEHSSEAEKDCLSYDEAWDEGDANHTG